MLAPQFCPRLPRPHFQYLVQLGNAVVRTLDVAQFDEDQRALLVVEAQDLLRRICEALVSIEDADPRWPGWSAIDPPRGTLADHLRAQRQERARGR